MTLATVGQCNTNINYNSSNKGIYFDRLSGMQLVMDEWKLVVFYDMNPYWQATKTLNKYNKLLQRSCNSTDGTALCDIILLQLQHGFAEIEYNDRILLNQQGSEPGRQRRGLINGVGYVANSLANTLVYYHNNIDFCSFYLINLHEET